MTNRKDYWQRYWRKRMSRRTLLRSAAIGSGALAAAAVVGCGDDEETPGATTPAATTPGATATATPTATAQPVRGGTYKWGSTYRQTTFDPNDGTFTERVSTSAKLVTPVRGPGASSTTAEVMGDAAAEFELPDDTTLVMTLRPNVRFSPPIDRFMTVEDVLFSFDRWVGDIPGQPPSRDAGEVQRIFQSWEAVDSQTVRFNLKQPQAALLNRLTGRYGVNMFPSEVGVAYDPVTTFVGAGPFWVTSQEPSVKTTYTRNPAWHVNSAMPYFDTAEEFLLPEYATRLTQFLGGGLDTLANVAGRDAERILDTVSGVQFAFALPAVSYFVTFSQKDPSAPWMNPKVRQALSMAIDRDAMAEAVHDVAALQSLELPVTVQWDNAAVPAYMDNWLDATGEGPNKMDPAAAKFYKYDPEGAKALLAETPWADGFSAPFGNSEFMGVKFSTNAELFAQYVSQIGVNLTLGVIDFSADYASFRSGDFEGLAYLPFYSGFVEAGQLMAAIYLTGATRNPGFSDAEVDAQINTIESNLDEDSRKQQLFDIQNLLSEKMYFVPLMTGGVPGITAYQSYVRNLDYTHVDGGNHVNFWFDKA